MNLRVIFTNTNFTFAGDSMASTILKACFSCGEDPPQVQEGRPLYLCSCNKYTIMTKKQ